METRGTYHTNGKIKVCHWWPGRQYEGTSPIPYFFIFTARAKGSRYLTYAWVELEDGNILGATAFCCPKDCPSRHRGREIAVGRLTASAMRHGIRI